MSFCEKRLITVALRTAWVANTLRRGPRAYHEATIPLCAAGIWLVCYFQKVKLSAHTAVQEAFTAGH